MSRSASAEPREPATVPRAERRRLLAVVALAALAACGKRGRLELPPEPDDEEAE